MAYQFKIQLQGISKPPIWRVLKIPDNFSFHQFHLAIQNAFGWYNCHLYQFSEQGWRSDYSIQMQHEDSEADELDSGKTKIKNYFKETGDKMIYIYDFGDDWKHQVVLENITADKILKPQCINGKGKCPPEDIGGIPGFQRFLKLSKNPKNPEYREMMEWLGLAEGEIWDPNEFDLEEANEMVREDNYLKKY